MGKTRGSYRTVWLCQCDCGGTKGVAIQDLGRGTLSCGCLQRERTRQASITHGRYAIGHAPPFSLTERSYLNMMRRCYDERHRSYPDYGARGIEVCAEWWSFPVFLRDMGERPSSKYCIDRKDPDANYSPDNCRWALRGECQWNTRRNSDGDLTGKRFGRLLVLSIDPTSRRKWIVRCDCGVEKSILRSNLTRNTRSCGCLRDDQVRKAMKEK